MTDHRPFGLRPALERLEPRENPAGLIQEGFDLSVAPNLPDGWSQWSNTGQSQFITSSLQAATAPNSLASLGGSATQSRFWVNGTLTADHGVGASVRSNTAAELELLARGSNLGTASPTYVSAVATAGGGVAVAEVRNGVRTVLGSVRPATPLPYSGVWLTVELRPTGDTLGVVVKRQDDGRYLTAAGGWQAGETEALRVGTAVRPAEGLVGVGRRTGGSGMAYLDDFAVLPPAVHENFDTTPPNTLPAGWTAWASDGQNRVGVGGTRFRSSASALGLSGASATAARGWVVTTSLANAGAEASVYADSLIPAGVFVRGANLSTATPTHYSLTTVRGLTVQLKKTVNGVETVLGSVRSAGYVSGEWVTLSLHADGNQLRGRVFRTDTNQWMAADGSWQNQPATAFSTADGSITAAGFAGVERVRSAFGTVWVDDFRLGPAGVVSGPAVSVTASQPGTTFQGTVRFTAAATPADRVSKVEFLLDGVKLAERAASPAAWDLDTTTLTNGAYTLTVRATDSAGNTASASLAFTVDNAPLPHDITRPAGVRKYSHIRLAQLAYAANPMGEYERQLARDSLDLIVPNTRFLPALEAAAADTPKVVYSNISNLYGDLLTDWYRFAAANGADRESAFFHVTQPTPFGGQSAASVPVREFWKVLRGPADGTPTDVTSRGNPVAFGGAGQAVTIGWTDRFREVNATLLTPAVGWAGGFEYVSEVHPDGSPRAWKTLPLLSNTTAGFTRDGQVLFDPPADWKPATMPGTTQLLYYVRVVTRQGVGPTAATLYGRDYVNAGGGSTGTIPAFDHAADTNGDGYLSDAEYATRTPGHDARFVHESRLFYPNYGAMRFVTNPGGPAFRNWAADYHQRLLAAHPHADGVFLDNSNGKLPFAGTPVREAVGTFTADLAAAVRAVTVALPDRWVVANTVGSIAEGDAIARQSSAVLEEFLLRPNDHNWSNLVDVKNLVDRRLAADSPSPYVILDTHPGSGSIASERTRIGALAYYYLLADPDKTFLMFFGGQNPSAAWESVFVPAATFDVGQPTGAMTTFAAGTDPQNPALAYKVYGREYENALVLFKPRSYTLGRGTGTADAATATTHQLNGNYRQLRADGTLGPVVTSVRLMNGEGAVLVKA